MCTPRYRGQEPCRFAGVPRPCSVFVAGSGRDPRAQQPSPLPYTVLLPTHPVTLSRKVVIARNSLRGVICSATTACLGRRYASLQPLLTSILCLQMHRGKGGFLTECHLPETFPLFEKQLMAFVWPGARPGFLHLLLFKVSALPHAATTLLRCCACR